MLLVAVLMVGHLADGLGRTPFVQDGALVGGGIAAGLVLREGDQWLRSCEEASGGAPIGYFRAADGHVLAATANGLITTSDLGCTWTPAEGVLRNMEVSAIRAAFDAPARVWLTTGKAGAANSLWRSDDGGGTFTESALAGVIHPLFDLATSDDGATVFVTGWDLDEEAPLVLGSNDSGDSFFGIADEGFFAGGYDRIRVLAVDDRVWFSLLSGTDAFIASADLALLDVRTEDQLPGEVLSLVPFQGARYVLARPGVLYRQASAGQPFQLVQGADLLCLERGDDDAHLWGCGNSGTGVQFFGSTDGATFTSAMGTSEIVDRTCPDGTPAAELCRVIPPPEDAGVPDPTDGGEADAGGEAQEDPGPSDGAEGDDSKDAAAARAPSCASGVSGSLWLVLCGLWWSAGALSRRGRASAPRRAHP